MCRCLLFILALYQVLPCDSKFMNYPGLRSLASKVNIVLGSGSLTRKLILLENDFECTLAKADIDERALGDRSMSANPHELVCLLANAKAAAILSKKKDSLS